MRSPNARIDVTPSVATMEYHECKVVMRDAPACRELRGPWLIECGCRRQVLVLGSWRCVYCAGEAP